MRFWWRLTVVASIPVFAVAYAACAALMLPLAVAGFLAMADAMLGMALWFAVSDTWDAMTERARGERW